MDGLLPSSALRAELAQYAGHGIGRIMMIFNDQDLHLRTAQEKSAVGQGGGNFNRETAEAEMYWPG